MWFRFRTAFSGRRAFAALMTFAILCAGLDIHGGDEGHRPNHDRTAIEAFADHDADPAARHEKAAGDHHCHGCVVLAEIDGDLAVGKPVPATPFVREPATLAGGLSDLPARPPRTATPLA